MVASFFGALGSIGASAISAFSNKDTPSMSPFDAYMWKKADMDLQNSYNVANMERQYQMNSALADKQFEQNKWFVQNSYQNAVADLRKAGLNPLLGIPNGAGGSVGQSSVGLPSQGLPDTLGSVSALSQSKTARAQLGINIANAISDIALKRSNSALAQEQSFTEANKRRNIDADTTLKTFQSMRQSIENSNLDAHMKSEIRKNIANAETSYINAYANQVSAKASQISASANSMSAKANYINATSGNLVKVGSQVVRNFAGTLPNNRFTRYINRIIK